MTALADELVANGKALAGSCMREDRDILVCYNKDNPPQEEPVSWFEQFLTAIWDWLKNIFR